MTTEEEKRFENRGYADGEQPVTYEQEQDLINKARGLGDYANTAQVAPQQIVPDNGTMQSIAPNVITTEKPTTHSDRMKELFALRMEKPAYDPNRPEELKRLARASVLAKGMNLIGDNIALAKNANVNRRQPDNTEKAYLGQMYNYLDNYTRRLDDWNYRDFVNKLRTGEMAMQQENWDRAFEQRQQNTDRAFASDQYNKDRDYLTKQDNFEKEMDFNEKKFQQSEAYQKMNANERSRHNKQMEAASMIRATNTGRGTGTTKEPYILWGDKGSKVELEQNEKEKVLSLILADPNIQVTDNDMELLEPKMGEPVSTNAINQIVQKYWQRSGAVQQYLKEKEGSQQKTPQTTTEQKTESIDYGKLNY